MIKHKHNYKIRTIDDIFKFCPCGKRKKIHSVKSERKALQRKAEDLWREYAHKRDGSSCQILRFYPNLMLNHSNSLQVDHFFPRADKNLFFETSNATVLCSNCNYLKSNGSRQSVIIQIALKNIVMSREGTKKFEEMFEINNSAPPLHNWNSIPNLELRIEYLKKRIEWLESDKIE